LGPLQEDALRLATKLTVPFEKNQAEQEIKRFKLRQKVSRCSSPTTGMEHFVNVPKVTSAARKQAVKLEV